MGYSPWGRKELDMTEQLNLTYALSMMLLTTVSNLFFSTLDIVRVY